jgi:two-component system sensor histidine kinase BaeS
MARSLGYIAGLIAMLLVALALVALVMQPAREDLPTFAVLLGTPVFVATVGAIVARRQAWWRQFHSVSVALFISYVISAGLILLTVFITARLMFISTHDATLALVIMVFATAVTLVFGYFVSTSLREAIRNLTRAAHDIRAGNLDTQVADQGSDELAELARAFNEMTTQLRQARDQETRLNTARRDLIAWVSHDLRTPITSLRARMEAIHDGVVSEPDEVADYLEAMRADTDALNHLINELFELATIEAGGLRMDCVACDLGDLLSDTIKTMNVIAASKGITLSGSVASDVGLVWLSPQHIQRVLNNLISNALAHTRAGGSVWINVCREVETNCVRVQVQDTGSGIAPEDVPHVFERFYRGERSRPRNGIPSATGMGLGLAIAQALVEAHAGKIGLTSEQGQGTTVWFSLPQQQ